MDSNKPKPEEIIETPEEQNAEKEELEEVKDEEIKAKLAEETGLDPETDAELLEKLVAREKTRREKFAKLIKQKRSWREKAQAASPKAPETPKPGESPKPGQETPNVDELVDKKLTERLEQRDLEALDLADDLKQEVKDLAKLKGISVKAAAQLPYIKTRIEEAERAKRIENATPKRSGGRGSYQSSYDPSQQLRREDFDFSTEDGRKAWEDAKVARRKYRDSH